MSIKLENKLEYKEPSLLNICTYTISVKITDDNIKNEIDLHLLSRFIPVYNADDDLTKTKEGCIIGINSYMEHKYSDLPSGNLVDKNKYPKSIFNNQLTVNYKYNDFKIINIKMFNGSLHLTGIKDYPWEVNHIFNYILDLFKKIKYTIYLDKNDLEDIKNYNYVLVYDKDDIVYYRKYIDYFNIEEYLNKKKNTSINKWMNKQECNDYVIKYVKIVENYEKEIDTIYDILLTNDKYNLAIRKLIYDKLIKFYHLKKIKENTIYYPDTKYKIFIKSYIKDIRKVLIKYKTNLNQTLFTDSKVIDKLKSLYPNIIKKIKNYIIESKSKTNLVNTNNIYKLDLEINKRKFNFINSDIQMIECNFKTGYGHKLKEFNNLLLNKYGIFNSYNPNNGHAGVLIRFYYNKKYLDKKPGRCYCEGFCRTKKGKDDNKCSILTIIVFRPSNIIIMGRNDIEEIKYAYDFINKFIKDNLNEVCYNINEDELNDNFRKKIIKKTPIYIKKSNIIYPSNNK